MNRKRAAELLKRMLPQILFQAVLIIFSSIASYMLMTWIIKNFIDVENIYLSSLYESLGMFVIVSLILVSINAYMYRKRLKEITIMSEAISKVANGNFEYRIPIKKRDPMAQVYEDFNKMTEELSSVQILRNDFINSYSHEFKTPLASISGFAELLMGKELSQKEQREYLSIIRDESERLATLARNTIMLSKLNTQRILTDVEEYDLSEQLRQCVIICSAQWTQKDQEFEGDFSKVMFRGNREILQQLWINIISNAIKYTPEKGMIKVSLKKEDNKAVISVSDTGEGMTEETIRKIYIPYYQGDPSHSESGLGLGLAISKRIVELCNGEITVSSTPGEGSTFKVILPLGQPENQEKKEKTHISLGSILQNVKELRSQR